MAEEGNIPNWLFWLVGITGGAFALGLFNRQRVISNMKSTKLAPNFDLSEFVRTSTGLDNIPPPEVVKALELLAMNVLQPLRNAVVKRFPNATVAVNITSGYRSPEVNAAVPGSSSTSQHPKGEAADLNITVDGRRLTNQQIIDIVRQERIPYDQMIDEQLTRGGQISKWVHLSYSNSKLRRQWLTARDKPGGGTLYTTVQYG
jgi:zinc D-Ala-D-Ala carboxypeptidase